MLRSSWLIRGGLFVVLLVWAVLVWYVPAINVCQGHFNGIYGDPPKMLMSASSYSSPLTPSVITESAVVDFEEHRVYRPVQGRGISSPMILVDGNRLLIQAIYPTKSIDMSDVTQRWFEWRDVKTGEVIESKSIKFGRFKAWGSLGTIHVSTDRKQIGLVDFADMKNAKFRTFPLNVSDHWYEIEGTNHVHTVEPKRVVVPAPVGTAKGTGPAKTRDILENVLYELDAVEGPKELARWVAGEKPEFSYTKSGLPIITVSEERTGLEIRSSDDGSLQQTVALPVGFDPLKSSFKVRGEMFVFDQGGTTKYYDAIREVMLAEPDDRGDWHVDGQWDGQTIWYSPDYVAVTRVASDGESKSVVRCKISVAGKGRWVSHLLGPDRLAVSMTRLGGSVEVYDVNSGQMIDAIRPYAWVGWVFPVALIGYVVWMVAWLRDSKHRYEAIAAEGGPPKWLVLDSLKLLGLPMIALVARVVLVGDSTDLYRPPFQYAQGISMAMLAMAVARFCWGQAVWTRRILPVAIVFVSIGFILAYCFRDAPQHATMAIVSVSTPLVVAAAALMFLRFAGCRISYFPPDQLRHSDQLRNSGQHRSARHVTIGNDQQSRWPIRDMFLITAAASMVFAAIRLLIPTLGDIPSINFMEPLLFQFNLIFLSVLMLALVRWRWVYAVGAVLCSCLIAWLIACVLYQYIWNADWADVMGMHPNNIVLATFATSLFVGLVPFRNAGYRIGNRFLGTA
ncbi:DUF3488 domain-containing protein [Rubripirellula reticaptiva]|uniref:Uncharacterized protein n=1 Tax=Rubripirellula reticaptiva TaxID=2528013 RepID=A0A5C6F6V4_9BACT|nr:DUF3488 domain-containing protein [Rubripirellula reticaptiva]TWU56147.1 hypothetical protein Poly59_24510 [Rubripirellula reticaptiva]